MPLQIDSSEAYAQAVDKETEIDFTISKSETFDPFNSVQKSTKNANQASTGSVSESQIAAQSNTEIYGDFNGDGFDDLAIGIPQEHVSSVEDAGAVEVIYGDNSGLDARVGDQFITSISLAGDTEIASDGDSFGASLAAGDFNGDGRDDLAIGAPGDFSNPHPLKPGAVFVVYGTALGLEGDEDPKIDFQIFSQGFNNINDIQEDGDAFGWSLTSGDFNGDGKDDLAIGVWWEDLGSIDDAGGVEVIFGSSSGLSATSPRPDQFWTQDSTDVNDVAESGDRFGQAVYSGDFNDDGKDDLAVGIPCEDVGTIGCGGGVEVIYGSSSGLSATSPCGSALDSE